MGQHSELTSDQQANCPDTRMERPSKLRVANLRKTYGPVVALAGANLEVREGEFVTLLGPSGSGKSTFLMLVAGLVDPDSGDIWIGGRLSTFAAPHHRDIGIVFQDYALFPHMTIAENIAFPLRMRGVSSNETRKRVNDALAIVQLSHAADRLPAQLSGGQQQRVALARCMIYRPSIILMDEPLGALDRRLREQMQIEIKRLHVEHGITVMYVTHDQEEALAMSDRICLMNEGRIVQVGTPEEIYLRPASAFAAEFLGEANMIDGIVREVHGDTVHIETPDGRLCSVNSLKAVPGQGARIVVRPEHIDLLVGEQRAQNELTVIITDMLFLGKVRKYCGRSKSGAVVMATTLARPGDTQVTVGDAVRLGWRGEDSVLAPGN